MVSLLQRRREMMVSESPGGAAPLYPLASGSHTFTGSYKGTLEVSDGNHISAYNLSATNTVSKQRRVDVSTLSANGANMYSENYKNNTTAIFTLEAGDVVSFWVENEVHGDSGIYNNYITCLLRDNIQDVTLFNQNSIGEVTTATITTSGTVTAVGCNLQMGGNGASRSFDLFLTVNGIRYI